MTTKTHLKGLLTACAVGLLVVPAAANARLDFQPQPQQSPPTAVRSDIQSAVYPSSHVVVGSPAVSLPATFVTDAQSGYRTAPAPQLSVVREIHTVTGDGGTDPLAIILASVALCIALAAAGYAGFRLRPQVGRLA